MNVKLSWSRAARLRGVLHEINTLQSPVGSGGVPAMWFVVCGMWRLLPAHLDRAGPTGGDKTTPKVSEMKRTPVLRIA